MGVSFWTFDVCCGFASHPRLLWQAVPTCLALCGNMDESTASFCIFLETSEATGQHLNDRIRRRSG
jgi:hypothetical protein